MKKLIVVLGLCCIAAIGFFCKKTDDVKPSDLDSVTNVTEVVIQDMAFAPTSVTIPANSVVKWINKDGTAHTVTSTTGLFDSGNLGNEVTYTHEFTSTGMFSYRCNLRSVMTGSVIVQ